MSSRTYLSIGDVLSLLREEFPDVTISKIRFLESQGLVNPERSPSGYRKFYDHDVERLRWVLRQQRENFLPLKVIRDRLVDEESDTVTAGRDAAQVPRNGPPEDDHRVDETDGQGASVLALSSARVVATGTSSDEPPAAPRVSGSSQLGAPDRSGEGAEPVPSKPPADEPAGEHALPGMAPRRTGEAPPGGSPPPAPESAVSEPPAAPRAGQAVTESAPAGAPAAEAPTETKAASAEAAVDEAPQGRAGAETGTAPAGGREAAVAGLSGVSMTAEELGGASGLATTDVAALEEFGLIASTVVAGTSYYDEEALILARLVAGFGRYGIEPRHLRLYRNAVERELGLIEQVVTPLLRQRNPEARQRAQQAASDLAELGQDLRSALVRRGMRQVFGG